YFVEMDLSRRQLHSFPTRRSSDLQIEYLRHLGTIGQEVREPFLDLGVGALAGDQRLDLDGQQYRDHDQDRADQDAARRVEHGIRSEEHTSELQSRSDLVCRLLLEK